MAVISDDFEQGVATQLEFSEMDDATLARWLTVPEAIDEWLRRRLGNESRFNKYHAKDGKFAGKNGGGAGTDDGPKISATGIPGVVVVDGKYLRAGDTFKHGGKTYKVTAQSEAQAVLKRTPPRPVGMKRAKTSSTKDKETAVHDGKAEFPKRDGGTQTVKPTGGKRLTPKEYERLAPAKVTADEKKAMDFYDLPRGGGKGSGANDMNWYLRQGGKSMSYDKGRKFDPKTAEHVKNLESAISRHTVPVDMVLTRRVHIGGLGVDPNSPEFAWGWGESKASAVPRIRAAKDDAVRKVVGHTFQDQAFLSTTLKEDIPGGAGVFGPYKLNIHVPKGHHAIFLSNPEQEVVLAPKTKLSFTSARKGADGGWEIDAQVVP